MDNLSRDNNNSFLPIAGVIVGTIGLILGGVALSKASKAATEESLATQVVRIDAIDIQAKDAATAAARAKSDISSLGTGVSATFGEYAKAIEELRGSVKTLQESAAKRPTASASTGPVVAGKDEYIVKQGDTGGKIAAANGTTVRALETVNPGIDWTRLRIGQKLKLPAK